MPLNDKNSDADMLDDAALIRAARKRILRELEISGGGAGGGGGAAVTNNVYGGGGLMERMNGAPSNDADLKDYMVDIERRDLPELNPLTGKPMGWTKKVHRHVEEKKK